MKHFKVNSADFLILKAKKVPASNLEEGVHYLVVYTERYVKYYMYLTKGPSFFSSSGRTYGSYGQTWYCVRAV